MKRILSALLLVFMLAACTAATVGTKASLSKEEKEELLKTRIADDWQAMVDRDRGKMYDMYDPFFRANVSKESFVNDAMPIYYHRFRIEKMDVKGNVAFVDTWVEYSIEHMGKLGKVIKKDKTEMTVKTTWLFVDHNWYRQYYDALTDGTFAFY